MKQKIIDWVFLVVVVILGIFGIIKELNFVCGTVNGIMLASGLADLYSDYKNG